MFLHFVDDLAGQEHVARTLAQLLHRPCLIVGKSTTPTGTAAILADRLARLAPAGSGVELAWSPEFLREGTGIADFYAAPFLVVGTADPAVGQAVSAMFGVSALYHLPHWSRRVRLWVGRLDQSAIFVR